jgi:serine/threonine protein phosphatase PrpC
VQDLIERLFGRKKKQESAADATRDTVSDDVLNQNQVTEEAAGAKGPDLFDQTVIVPGGDLSDPIRQATGNVFEDTMPGNAALEATAIGLPAEQIVPSTHQLIGLSAAQRCHIGNVRNRNEDSSFIFTAEFGGQEPLQPTGLYIVADGMGGHHAGHEASKNAARMVAQQVLERIYVPLLHNSTAGHGQPLEPIGEVMVDAVQAANLHIHDNDPKKSSGTTLTAALILGRRLYVAHVGDSRGYLLSDGELKLLTTDHSYVRRLQDAGQLTEEEAAVHPQRNMLYKAVGQGGDLDIDTFTKSLPNQGKLILCSDGLWGLVSDESMSAVLNRDISLAAMTDELILMARNAGGHDNITAIVVDFNF